MAGIAIREMSNVVNAFGFALGVVWINLLAGGGLYAILSIYLTFVDDNARDVIGGKSRRVLVIRAVAEMEIVHETLMLAINLFVCSGLFRHPSLVSMLFAGVVVLPRVWLLGDAIVQRVRLDRLPLGARFLKKVSLESPGDPQPEPAPSQQQREAFEALKRRGYRRLALMAAIVTLPIVALFLVGVVPAIGTFAAGLVVLLIGTKFFNI
jgi:hypothetical protein